MTSPGEIGDEEIEFQNRHKYEKQEPTHEQSQSSDLTAAQRARSERNRLRARALQDARLTHRDVKSGTTAAAPLDSGGGFLLEEEESEPDAVVVPAAPLVHHSEQPVCLECKCRFPQSFLFDKFDYEVCDECRDEAGEHALVTRTEAKTEFLLKDCDLDARPPPLRCLRRRNPHSARYGDMRLYLAAQVRARALEVWGSEEALECERDRRRGARATGRAVRAGRRLRALRLDVRSSVYTRRHAEHEHEFAPERRGPLADEYSRECITCGHLETYEKM